MKHKALRKNLALVLTAVLLATQQGFADSVAFRPVGVDAGQGAGIAGAVGKGSPVSLPRLDVGPPVSAGLLGAFNGAPLSVPTAETSPTPEAIHGFSRPPTPTASAAFRPSEPRSSAPVQSKLSSGKTNSVAPGARDNLAFAAEEATKLDAKNSSLAEQKAQMGQAFDRNQPHTADLVFVPTQEVSVPRVSLGRAWKHSFSGWKGNRALRVPLTSTDHQVLTVLAFTGSFGFGLVYPGVQKLMLKWSIAEMVFLLLVTVFYVVAAGLILVPPHMREAQDGRIVADLAKQHLKNKTADMAVDGQLMSFVQGFERKTGWQVVWTQQPHLLAQADPDQRRIILNIGWILAGGDKKVRRIRYLNHTLNILSRAIAGVGS